MSIYSYILVDMRYLIHIINIERQVKLIYIYEFFKIVDFFLLK